MKNINIILCFFLVLLARQQLVAWDLVHFFSSKKTASVTIQPHFDEKDIVFLPKLEEKNFFSAIDDMSICRKESVRKYIFHYLTVNRTYTIRAIQRSQLYLDEIYKIFRDSKEVPADLALLPLLESGFYPFAISRSSAVGLWQLMRGTSSHLGLTMNRLVDERRDIEKSTRVAIRHLKNMYTIFGSWELALAAYNGGGKYVKTAIRKTKSKCLWQLVDTGILARQTHEYVPRFAALVIIYKNQDLFGIKDEIQKIEKKETAKFHLQKPVLLSRVAHLAGTSIKTIKELNPELLGKVTPPLCKNYGLKLPVESIEQLAKKTKSLYAYNISHMKKYKVKKGDTICGIARRFKVGNNVLLRHNNIKDPGLIRPGRILYIPN